MVSMKFEYIDITRVMDENLVPYSEGAYTDPPFQLQPWCTIQEQGYLVNRISMGTQTGTHIDAPSHFIPGGETLDALSLETLIGPYYWLDMLHLAGITQEDIFKGYQNQSLLFLFAESDAEIKTDDFEAMLNLPCRVWITPHKIYIPGKESLLFHKTLFQAGKFLVEDLDKTRSSLVKPGGEIMVLPLNLRGASGSPCRVVVRQERQ